MPSSDLRADFASPPNAYRGKPFWSWNGALERAELLRQIGVLRRMGMGGYFMHSRTGLRTEYLGDTWFNLINACADEGERLGMEAWLYDEDRWPSGTAGGLVTEDPAFRMRYVRMIEQPSASADDTRDALAVFTCRREGLEVRDVQPIEPGTEVEPQDARSALIFTVVEMACDSVYNGFTYVDTMNRAATDRYIELTHEQYAARCGARMGTSIRGIFTDEPHRGALMDPFGGEGAISEVQAPWTSDLRQRFLDAFGYDVVDRLPELFLRLDGKHVSQVKWHYVELLMRLFLERFAAPYDDWCRRHGIISTGHVLHEDSLSAQTAMCGSVMRYYPYLEYPGIDLLTEGNRAYWVAKQLQSVGAQIDRPFLLSELYGCTGWEMPFAGHKHVGDWQALFGINVRCPHLSWYTMEGEAKRDYPASIFHQSAWWRLYALVETYFARIGLLMSEGRRLCDVLVIHPVESVWCRVRAGWSRYLGGLDPEVQQLERRFAETFEWLQGSQIDFDYADEAMLAEMGAVQSDGSLKVGRASYRAVVVAGMDTIRSSTVDLLGRLMDAGGCVVAAGTPPAHQDALPSDAPAMLAARAVQVPWDRDALVQALRSAAPGRVSVTDRAAGRTATSVYCHLREQADGSLCLMALNVDRDRGIADAEIAIDAMGAVQEWNCLTGETTPIPPTSVGAAIRICTTFEPGGERIYTIDPTRQPVDEPSRTTASSVPIAVRGPYRYRLSEPNVAVLDIVRYRVGDAEWSEPTEVLKADIAVRRTLGIPPRGGSMLQPWFAARSGPVPERGAVIVAYGFDIEDMPQCPVELAVEQPGRIAITLNGQAVAIPAEPARWIDACLARVPLPASALRPGRNTIEIACRYADDMGLEACYLLGAFGVRVDGDRATLIDLPETLAVGDVTSQGLPFYGGAITYHLTGLPAPSEGGMFLRASGMSAACAYVDPSDAVPFDTSSLDLEAGDRSFDPRRLIAWAPWTADLGGVVSADGRAGLHVYLTRRNTFGPLHQWPARSAGYGPGNWLTDGEAFRQQHVLWPSGLLAEPEIVRTVKGAA